MQSPENSDGPGTTRRLLWFIALWCAGVATLGALAYILRLVIGL